MAKYVVTSGLSYIGVRLARELQRLGHEVDVFDTPEHIARRVLAKDQFASIQNVLDEVALKDSMLSADACFHLDSVEHRAGMAAHISSIEIARLVSSRVFELARLYKVPVVYSSSADVYGDSTDIPLKETSLTLPVTTYAAYLWSIEDRAQQLTVKHGVPTVGLRIFSVYGPRDEFDVPAQDVISRFIDNAHRNQPIQIEGDGNQSRDFIYIDDVVQHFVAALKRLTYQPKVFNVCSGRPVTIRHLAGMIGRFSGKVLPLEYRPTRRGDIRIIVGDPTQAKQQLNTGHRMSLCAGLISMLSSVEQKRRANKVAHRRQAESCARQLAVGE